MSDLTPHTPHRALPRSMPITPERARVFVETLRQTGSYHAAAAAASPHLVKRGSRNFGVGSFREYARRNPEFAADVEAAMGEVRGRMESLVLERAMTPDEKPIFNQKTGQLLGVQKDTRNANQMLALWLASHDPATWATKQHIKTDVTVTNNGELAAGANYVIRPNDILLLSDAERASLIDLLSKIEELREPEALPEPKRDYNNQGWASDTRALPATTDTDKDAADGPA
jgi:hypothetical protein